MAEVFALKVRIKFSKKGPVKFIGHLDTMRYFQKALRRAELPVAFSGGYSPHMIMSFAAPLGVGAESEGEYFDLEMSEDISTREICERLDAEMADGFRVTSCKKVEDGKASTAMSLVAACDYRITFRYPVLFDGWQNRFEEFMSQDAILVIKKTKKGQREMNLKELIYGYRCEADEVYLQLASASANYTKPELVMETFFEWAGHELPEYALSICRLEVYADLKPEDGHQFITLMDLGEDFE